MQILEKILARLDISPPARQVYIDLVENGSSPARTIAMRLEMTRPSVYDQLKQLATRGLVVERDLDGKTEFSISDIEDLEKMMEEEKRTLEALQSSFGQVKKTLTERTESVEPKIKFVTGKEAILQSMHDLLWDERLTLQLVWPYYEMIQALGKEALIDFNRKRVRNRIRLETIWPTGTKPGEKYIWKDGDWGVKRRCAPKSFAPPMSYIIYGDKVLFISSAAEAYGFIVTSRDFATLQRQQFALIWKLSEESR